MTTNIPQSPQLAGDALEAALSELSMIEGEASPESLALHVQLLRAAGRHRDAHSLVRRRLAVFMSSESVLRRVLPALLNGGWNDDTRQDVRHILAEAPDEPLIVSLYELKALVGDAPEFLARLRDAARGIHADDLALQIDDEINGERPHPKTAATDDLVGHTLRLFSGLQGIHAEQIRTQAGWGYAPVRREMTAQDLTAHLEGRRTLGIYPLRSDGTVYATAIDVDVRKQFIDDLASDLYRSGLFEGVRGVVHERCEALAQAGLEPHVEFSGFKGFHIWVFFDEPVEARIVRKLILGLTNDLGLPRHVSTELFPKQDKLKDGQIGNLIKLPCGLHRKSGRFSCWVHRDTLTPVDDQEAYLLSIRRVSRDTIIELSRRMGGGPPDDGPETLLDEAGLPIDVTTIGPTPTEVLVVGPPAPVIQRVLDGCPVMAALVSRADTTHSLAGPEVHVLTYVFGVLGDEGRTFVHRTLHRTLEYEPGTLNRKLDAVPPNPMSCPKIRKWLPDAARVLGCTCKFHLPPDGYPSPLVHAGIYPRCAEKVARPVLPSVTVAAGTQPYVVVADVVRSEPPPQPPTVAPLRSTAPGHTGLAALLSQLDELQGALTELRGRLDAIFDGRDGELRDAGGTRIRRQTVDGRVRFDRLPPES